MEKTSTKKAAAKAEAAKTHRWQLLSRDGAFLTVGRAATPDLCRAAATEWLQKKNRKLGTVTVFSLTNKGEGGAFREYPISTTKLSVKLEER